MYFFPLKIDAGTSPAIANISISIDKMVYITENVDITPSVEALLIIRKEVEKPK